MIITDITSTKLRQKQEKDMLIEKSSIDQLTGLHNKQYYTDYYINKKEWVGVRLAILFIDIDGFKSINDLYGHMVGDEVLKNLANCIKNNISSKMKAIRFGGDEFVIILEETSKTEAYLFAEKLRIMASNLDFSKYIEDIKISLSIGLAEGSISIHDLIVKADMAMYESKSKGKNKVTIFSESNNIN